MQTECVKEAATVEEAVDAALEELGVQQDAVSYEVLEEPGRKVFGLGGERQARVRVWIREDALATLAEDEDESEGSEELGEEHSPDEVAAPAPAETELPELSDEELDKVADTAVDVVRNILVGFGMEAEIEEYEGDEGEIILDVVGSDSASLIGRHGRTLDSLQIVTSAITNKSLGFRYPVVVDVEGYRHRRRQKLEEIATRAAERAARNGTPVRLRPMTAYERRIVHMVLRADRRVTTASEGEDPFRAVVVNPS
jgi:spoIIIJ-associated protein